MKIASELSLQEKLHILADGAKYDVACTSSGADRRGRKGCLGNAVAAGICHSFASDGRCISLLKILLTNHCIYDCKYCINRCTNDIARAAFTPREVCELTTEFYRRNYIEGLFLSSGVWNSPAFTMERLCETLYLLRNVYHFNGYIHVKAIPGAPDELRAAAGYLADRMSINLELPTGESMKKLAPNKNHNMILRPMQMMAETIAQHRLAAGKSAQMERSRSNRYLTGSIFSKERLEQTGRVAGNTQPAKTQGTKTYALQKMGKTEWKQPFVPAGQSTQMIIGATPETDYHLLRTTQYLYQNYDLKRVFYSAYVPLNEDGALPAPDTPVPLLREHRLYQADWLLRFYGFSADELLSEQRPNFNEELDPKCDWALRHLERFPVEVNTAQYETLLRVPGVGPKSALRIVQSRRYGKLDFAHLKRMGVVLKRAHYFLTCDGKMMYHTPIEENYITRQLTDTNRRENWQIAHRAEDSYRQMSLFEVLGQSENSF